jgi:hypothetical protein
MWVQPEIAGEPGGRRGGKTVASGERVSCPGIIEIHEFVARFREWRAVFLASAGVDRKTIDDLPIVLDKQPVNTFGGDMPINNRRCPRRDGKRSN